MYLNITSSKNNFNISVPCYEGDPNTLNFSFEVVNNWTDDQEVLFNKRKLVGPALKFFHEDAKFK